MSNSKKEIETKDEAWSTFENSVKNVQDKINSLNSLEHPTNQDWVDLKNEAMQASKVVATLIEQENGFDDKQQSSVEEFRQKCKSIISECNKKIQNVDPSATNIEAKSPSRENVSKSDSAITQMKAFFALAQSKKGDLTKVNEIYSKFINLRSKVGNDEKNMMEAARIEKDFKALLNSPQLSSGASAASAQAVVAKSAQKDDVVVAKEVAPNSAQMKKSASAEAAVEQARPAPRSSGPAMEVKVDEGVLPAGGLSMSELQKQLTDIAKDNKWGISFPGKDIKIVDQGQSVTVSPTKEGMKIEGSPEVGVKVLDKWCEKNKFDKLDVKVSMPTVGKNIDPKSPEGDAAWKSFSSYNEKGFVVKDFPIDNFKDKPNYAEMKQKYDDMKQQVAAKDISTPKMSG